MGNPPHLEATSRHRAPNGYSCCAGNAQADAAVGGDCHEIAGGSQRLVMFDGFFWCRHGDLSSSMVLTTGQLKGYCAVTMYDTPMVVTISMVDQ